VLIIVSWQGLINLGSIQNLWKKTATTTPVTTTVDTKSVNDKTRKSDLANLKAALTAYYQAEQSYPVAETSQKTSDKTSALSVLVPTYIAALPDDPLAPTYYYGYKSDGKTFELTAVLEDRSLGDGTLVGSLYLYKVTDTSAETPSTTSSSTDTTTTTDTTTDATTTTSGTAAGTSTATTTN